MDNRVFNINGKGDETLLLALELAFLQNGSLCRGWSLCEKGLILLWYTDETDNKFPTSKGLSAKEVFPLVKSWLGTDEAKKVEMEGWDCNEDHDGSNSLGWRVFCEDWGHVADSHYAICCVKPAYMWHGK